MRPWWLVVVVVVVWVSCCADIAPVAACPWEETGLLNWSSPATWDSNKVPVDGEQVTIPANKRVVLDKQPASLATLTIEGALVWGNVDNLVLNSHHILVKGEFHIGSNRCRFPHSAHIRLHGNSTDSYTVPDHSFDRKFIGVSANATLEIHGRLKTSWTKLAQTVLPLQDLQCGTVYDHGNFKQNKAGVTTPQGVSVNVWNADGSQLDFFPFKANEYDTFASFFDSIPDKAVIAMFVYGTEGIGTTSSQLINPIVALGGSLIKDIKNNYGFSFLVRKGFNDTVREVLRADNSIDGEGTGFLTYEDSSKDIAFQVAINPGTVRNFPMFRVVNLDALYPKLTLADEVKGWRVGDEIVVASTDFDWKQAEVRKIVSCNDCAANQIRVNETFTYLHFGNFTKNVDERAEVGMLSRYVVVEGVVEDTCTERTQKEKDLQLCTKYNRDTFGGHLKVVRYFNKVRIRGAQFLHMGQQMHKGFYPMHFHMVDSAKGSYLRENSVVDSFSRCITVHGTDWLEVSDNVCYRHLGHGLFLEDAVEQNNLVHGNLILGSMHGTLLLSDRKKEWCSADMQVYCGALSSFWLTHPNNNISNNAAAGGDGVGYFYIFADRPLGPSVERQKELNRKHDPKSFPLIFTKNVAHSQKETGVHMDEKISTGTGMENKGNITENAILRVENEYDPQSDGTAVWTEMSYGTYYKNKFKNMWIKGGNVRVSYSALADSKEGFTGGTTLTESGTEVYKCLFIGETDNKGYVTTKKYGDVALAVDRSYAGEAYFSLTAVSLYQGPNIVRDCFFDRYTTRKWCLDPDTSIASCGATKTVTRYSSAISFKRSNTYPTMTSTYAIDNKFGFCDNVSESHWVFQGADGTTDWDWKDGNRGLYLRDQDGHLTGTPNASIVPNYPLYSGDECLLRSDWGDMLVCPYRYVKMELLGSSGNLSPNLKSKYPLIVTRDDAPYNVPFKDHMGEIRNEFLLRTNRSYIVDFNRTLNNAAFPKEIKVFGYGVEKGDIIRVGLCQPKDVQGFEIIQFYPTYVKNNATWVDSLAKLDADTTGAAFFHDKSNGILFFKLLSFHQDTNATQRCPAGNCVHLIIRPDGGTLDNVRTCRSLDIPAYVGSLKTENKPTVPKCPGIASPEGYGSVVWSDVGHIEHNDYTVQCVALDAPFGGNTPTFKGCYQERYDRVDQDLKTTEVISLFSSMTIDFCVNRCYYRNYQYAAVSRGHRCTCSNSLLESEGFPASASSCNIACRGNATQTCGGNPEIAVWNTGR